MVSLQNRLTGEISASSALCLTDGDWRFLFRCPVPHHLHLFHHLHLSKRHRWEVEQFITYPLRRLQLAPQDDQRHSISGREVAVMHIGFAPRISVMRQPIAVLQCGKSKILEIPISAASLRSITEFRPLGQILPYTPPSKLWGMYPLYDSTSCRPLPSKRSAMQ